MKKYGNKIGLVLLCVAAIFASFNGVNAENYQQTVDSLTTIKDSAEKFVTENDVVARNVLIETIGGEFTKLPLDIQDILKPLIQNLKKNDSLESQRVTAAVPLNVALDQAIEKAKKEIDYGIEKTAIKENYQQIVDSLTIIKDSATKFALEDAALARRSLNEAIDSELKKLPVRIRNELEPLLEDLREQGLKRQRVMAAFTLSEKLDQAIKEATKKIGWGSWAYRKASSVATAPLRFGYGAGKAVINVIKTIPVGLANRLVGATAAEKEEAAKRLEKNEKELLKATKKNDEAEQKRLNELIATDKFIIGEMNSMLTTVLKLAVYAGCTLVAGTIITYVADKLTEGQITMALNNPDYSYQNLKENILEQARTVTFADVKKYIRQKGKAVSDIFTQQLKKVSSLWEDWKQFLQFRKTSAREKAAALEAEAARIEQERVLNEINYYEKNASLFEPKFEPKRGFVETVKSYIPRILLTDEEKEKRARQQVQLRMVSEQQMAEERAVREQSERIKRQEQAVEDARAESARAEDYRKEREAIREAFLKEKDDVKREGYWRRLRTLSNLHGVPFNDPKMQK